MFFSKEQTERLCAATVHQFLLRIDEARLLQGDAARLAGVARLTVGKWREETPKALWAGSFLRLRAATAWLESGLAAGYLPAADRYTARLYIDCLSRGIKDWAEIERRVIGGQKEAPGGGGKEDCKARGNPNA